MLSRRMLSKEEEASLPTSGGEETEVRREDQDKINRFSRLHQREAGLEEELKGKNKTKEDLDDLTSELELADEDEKIPYKLGTTFLHLPLSTVQDLLAEQSTTVEKEGSVLEEKLAECREEMGKLKVQLYARFGRGINLDV
ncbi:hypothetical protein MMC10_009062 [Thelotrema lepadinum]|nr:hypothetical protein [Thelotrema lepadinum]